MMAENQQKSEGLFKGFRQTFLSLRNRNFKLFFYGQLISNTGNWLTNVAIILLVLNITHSGFAVGLLNACMFGPILFLSPFGGAVADRFDKRKMLLWTQSLEMAQSVGLAILAFLPHPPVIGFFILAFTGGVLLAFDNPFRRSFVSEMVRPEDIPNAVVLYSTLVNISRVFGPALAGFLAVTVGFGWCFTLDALSYVAVIVGIIMMRPAELYRDANKDTTKKKGQIREAIRYIFETPNLFIGFIMLALIGTLSYNYTVTFPLFVTNALHGNNATFTIIYSVFSLGSVACALVIAQMNFVRVKHIVAGAAMMSIAMLLFAFTSNVITASLAAFLVGATSIVYMNATTANIQVEGKKEMHGRVLSFQAVFLIGTTVIGGPFCGWMSDAFGSRSPIIFGAVVCLAAAAFGFITSHRTNKQLSS
jgi:MFS family permease